MKHYLMLSCLTFCSYQVPHSSKSRFREGKIHCLGPFRILLFSLCVAVKLIFIYLYIFIYFGFSLFFSSVPFFCFLSSALCM